MELRAPCPINNVASVRVLAPSTLPWGRGGVLAFIFSMFMFLDKRSCVNQTASFCRAGFWVWFGLVSLVPLLGSSGVTTCTGRMVRKEDTGKLEVTTSSRRNLQTSCHRLRHEDENSALPHAQIPSSELGW